MRVVKARTLEVRHRVCFDPKNVVKNPVVEVLNDFSNTENIVVTANNPNRAIVFEHTPTLRQPFGCKIVVSCKTVVFVPVVVDRRYFCVIWPPQVTFEL